jgi:DNA-directed RNA polymerase specialized sigma24 family protein
LRFNESSAGIGAGQFRTTCWSAVLLSAQSQAPGSDIAREELCRLYWYPLYAFVRRRGNSAEDAKDLTQGFFLSLFDRKALDQVTPLKGKFRSFLLASLKNYLSVEFHRENTIKRGGTFEFVPLDFEGGDDRYSYVPSNALTPEKIFDARWAITLLDMAMNQLRAEYASRGKSAIFDALKTFLDLVIVTAYPLTKQWLRSSRLVKAPSRHSFTGCVSVMAKSCGKRFVEP